MTELLKTYIVLSDSTLHDLFKNKGVPTNRSLIGSKIVRAKEEDLEGVRFYELVCKVKNATDGESFKLATQVCFSKHKSRSERNGKKFKAIDKQVALDLFCEKSGLSPVNGAYSVQPVIDEDLTINGYKDYNTFIITGTFKVKDFAKFEQAYNFGVGRRRSYGCGLILVL